MAKADRTKLPKTIAGFKVPKAVRKSEFVEALAASPTGRRLLADALIAAASAASAALAKASETPHSDVDPAKPGSMDMQSAAAQAAIVASAFLTAAAEAIRPAPESAPEQAAADSAGAPALQRKARRPRAAAAPAPDATHPSKEAHEI